MNIISVFIFWDATNRIQNFGRDKSRPYNIYADS